ncbi:hypothetical protein [Streptomyces avermitilis]|uniref:hypothetical protein n=1 Tax=Streptomyces avermitilis TaxID=33903 RepID=UPI0038151050
MSRDDAGREKWKPDPHALIGLGVIVMDRDRVLLGQNHQGSRKLPGGKEWLPRPLFIPSAHLLEAWRSALLLIHVQPSTAASDSGITEAAS